MTGMKEFRGMHLVENPSNDPYYNLAFEEFLFHKAERENRGFAMLWINAPAVVVGRFQNTRGEVNAAEAASRDIAVVRRITGGGAVYHDFGNLNYTFVFPQDEGEPHEFARFAEPIVSALGSMGLRAKVDGRNDMTTVEGGKKISGTAQHASKSAILHHGTILFDVDLEILQLLLTVDPAKFTSKGLPSIRSRVTNIRKLLKTPMSMPEFRETIRSHLNLPDEKLSSGELALVEQLAKEKYRTWEWNWGKSPAFTERKEKRFSWGRLEVQFDVHGGVVRECRIFGDFFGEGAEIVENALAGVAYKEDAIQNALRPLPLVRCFTGASEDEVLSFFCG